MKILRALLFVLLWLLTVGLVVIWDQNPWSILACALGVTAAVLVVFRLRWRRGIGAAASALFVVNWALAFIQMGGGAPFVAYAAVVQGATQSNSLTGMSIVLAYEVALPVMHLIVAAALVVGLVRRM